MVKINNQVDILITKLLVQYFPNVSRIAVIIAPGITYQRLELYEDDRVPCIIIKLNLTPRKHVIVASYYRQWSLINKNLNYAGNKPEHQIVRFNRFRKVIDNIMLNNESLIIAGDLNLDRWLPNDPYTRPDIKDTLPLLDELLDEYNLAKINNKCTTPCQLQKSSILSNT